MIFTSSPSGAGRPRGTLFRSAALCLALVIAGHLLPCTLVPGGGAAPGDEPAGYAFFEPLQVCDDGSEFSGFLADHPWLPGSFSPPGFVTEGTTCLVPSGDDLPEGIPFRIYRPPRPVLS